MSMLCRIVLFNHDLLYRVTQRKQPNTVYRELSIGIYVWFQLFTQKGISSFNVSPRSYSSGYTKWKKFCLFEKWDILYGTVGFRHLHNFHPSSQFSPRCYVNKIKPKELNFSQECYLSLALKTIAISQLTLWIVGCICTHLTDQFLLHILDCGYK